MSWKTEAMRDLPDRLDALSTAALRGTYAFTRPDGGEVRHPPSMEVVLLIDAINAVAAALRAEQDACCEGGPQWGHAFNCLKGDH